MHLIYDGHSYYTQQGIMKSTEYIINRLEDLVIRINNIRVSYEYDNDSLTHFIEVLPNSLYSLNQEYIEFEDQMFHEFISIFPYENICFLSDDAIVKIENPIFVKEGLGYAPFSTHEDAEFKVSFPEVFNGSSIFCPIPVFNTHNQGMPEPKKTTLPSIQEYALAA